MRVQYRYVSHGAGRQMIEQMQQMHQLMHQLIARAAPGTAGVWQPPTDVYESENALVVQVELAGVRDEDIDITLYADHLAISGTRQSKMPPGTTAYHLAGIMYGAFRIELPMIVNVDREQVEASFENGLLTVVLPKAASRQPSAVSIQPPVVSS